MPHAVGIESQDLVPQILRLPQVPPGLEPGRRQVELFDAALPLARFDQRLAQSLVALWIVRVIGDPPLEVLDRRFQDRKSTRLNSSHGYISYAVFCLQKKKFLGLTGFEVANNHYRVGNQPP